MDESLGFAIDVFRIVDSVFQRSDFLVSACSLVGNVLDAFKLVDEVGSERVVAAWSVIVDHDQITVGSEFSVAVLRSVLDSVEIIEGIPSDSTERIDKNGEISLAS